MSAMPTGLIASLATLCFGGHGGGMRGDVREGPGTMPRGSPGVRNDSWEATLKDSSGS